jgi:branched-chain amino acid transport system permease protein
MLAQTIANGLVTGCLYVMMAIGFSIIKTSMNLFNMSHGSMVLTGAYGAYIFGGLLHLGWIAAIIGGTVFGCAVHLLVAQTIYFPIQRRGLRMWIVGYAGFGVAILIQASIGMIFGTQPVDVVPGYVSGSYAIGSVRITTSDVAIAAVVAVAVVLYTLFLRKTRFGLATRAAVVDREMAGIVGIRTSMVQTAVFAVGAGMAALAGALMTTQGALQYTMGGPALLKAIVASILGISWGVPGAVIGGLVLGVMENTVVSLTNAGWRDGISLVILLAFVWSTAVYRYLTR